ncbi:ComEA family DNA-binding protein [Bacillus horti]|uniref:Competence protein ComEA n=1 Tax=Caldalkalibacillus horti TaxID=77523 RepID=A0ABT9VT04_9BACI|nr:ComEA family DNA-binding protein [Bacillus horti]MDQ0164124.1 competence protein ComEA [Bacillus horti]
MKKKWTSREKKWLVYVAIACAVVGSLLFSFFTGQKNMEQIELELVYEGTLNGDEQHEQIEEPESEGKKTNQGEHLDQVKLTDQVNQVDQVSHTDVNEVIVDVKGAVDKPGVYNLQDGDRVIDALNKAGQVRAEGSTNHINLAQKVYDGMVIYVPTLNEIEDGQLPVVLDDLNSPQTPQSANSPSSSSGKININTASADELQNLPGVGASRAQAIIQYRTEQGLFQHIEELMNISGIGSKIYDQLKEMIEI